MLKTVSTYINVIGALVYKGTWNAAINDPTLTSSVGDKGDYYVVSVAGSTNLNGITDWQVNDIAVFNGAVWQKIDNTDAVLSVNGQTGVVVLTAVSVGATPNTAFVLAGTGISANANITSVVATFPNNYLANSSTTLGNATLTLGSTTTSVGNLTLSNTTITSGNATLSNVTVTSNLNANLATSNTAAMPDPSLPLAPEGYITVYVNGSAKKIPYYGV
jgi:hypothetical protein